MKKNGKKKGFTLIELIVVIAILGILALIAVPRFAGMNERAKVQADTASLQTIQAAVRTYEAEKGTLPTALTMNAFKSDYISGGTVPAMQATANSGKKFVMDTTTGEVTIGTAGAAGASPIAIE